MSRPEARARGGRAGQWGALALGAVGLAGVAAGAATDPRRAAFAYLAAFAFAASLAVGALLLVMIAHLSNADWFLGLRRPAEVAALGAVALVPLALPLAFWTGELYPWAARGSGLGPAALALVEERGAWLSEPFFLARGAVYLAVWAAAAWRLHAWSVRQDAGEGEALRRRQKAFSAAALPAVAFAATFAAFDWLMSLSLDWASSAWGVYWFAGGFVGALGLLAALAPAIGRAGPRLGAGHGRALGNLLLAAVLFWGYVAYSQYFIVWIADLPREAAWYLPRLSGSWGGVALALLAGHLLLPFLVLLPGGPRRRPRRLAAVGAWIVAMHYLDLYWLVLPALRPEGVRPHWLDAAALLGVLGPAVSFGAWSFRRHAPAAVGAPGFARSTEYGAGSEPVAGER